jgi:hypothetical protein
VVLPGFAHLDEGTTEIVEPYVLPLDVWTHPRQPMRPGEVMHRAVLLQGLALNLHLLGERLRDGEGGNLDAELATTLDRMIEITLEVRSSLGVRDERVA